MRKKTIAWLFILGLILTIAGVAMWYSGIVSANSIIDAANANPTEANVQAAHDAAVAALYAPLPIALAAIGIILNFISWIGALVATAKQGRWGWFVAVLLLSGLGQLIYLIAGPGLKPASAVASAQ